MRSGFLGRGIGPNALGGGGGIPADPVPVAGAELLENWDFSSAGSWTLGAGWTIGSGALNGSVTGAVSSHQAVAFGMQWLRLSDSVTHTAGDINVFIGTSDDGRDAGSEWRNSSSARIATGLTLNSTRAVVYGVDFVGAIDYVSALPLTLSSLISIRPYASADCDISAAITWTIFTQVGLAARVDNQANPQNFIVAVLTMDVNGTAKVTGYKCVAGTYTNVISGAVTYAAGHVLRLVCSGNDVSCYYNGVQVGTTVTVADAGIVGNKNHGKFSTYAANTLANYVAA